MFYPNELNSQIFGHTRMKNFRPECHKCHNRTLPTKENDGTLELEKRKMEGKWLKNEDGHGERSRLSAQKNVDDTMRPLVGLD